MSEYLDTMHGECENIRVCSEFILTLSRAFYRTGNEHMGEELAAIAVDINDSQKAISGAVGAEINRHFHDTQESTNAMVGAALTSCLMKAEEG